ncbi:hypothetical protein AUP68_00864 [Ilyonectria robusta]
MSDGQDGQDGHPFADFEPGKAPYESKPELIPSLGPQPKSDMEAGVSGILNKLHQTTINAQAKWTMVSQSGCMTLWAATKKGGDVTLEPVIGGLKQFLKDLYALECTSASDSMDCKGVEVCFMWRSDHEGGLGAWTPPCEEENSSEENSSDKKSGEKSDKKSDKKPEVEK